MAELFGKTIYATRPDIEVIVSLSDDALPIPQNKGAKYVVIEADTGKIYIWDGQQFNIKIDPEVKVLA